MEQLHVVGLIKTERFNKNYCKIRKSERYGSCYHSEIFNFESGEFLIKSNLLLRKITLAENSGDNYFFYKSESTNSILHVLSFGLWLSLISKHKNSRISRLILKTTDRGPEKILTFLYSCCGTHTAVLLYNGIQKEYILLKITDWTERIYSSGLKHTRFFIHGTCQISLIASNNSAHNAEQ